MSKDRKVSDVVTRVDLLCKKSETVPSDLVDDLAYAEDALHPMQAKIDELTEKASSKTLSAGQKALLGAEIMDLRTKMEPYRWIQQRIIAFTEQIRTQGKRQLKVFRFGREYADRQKVEMEIDSLTDDIVKSARRIRHGLSGHASWVTQRKYSALRIDFDELLKAGDSKKSLDLATKLLEQSDPALLVKVSSFDDIRTTMLESFVDEAKK
jgi:hypothetical protein